VASVSRPVNAGFQAESNGRAICGMGLQTGECRFSSRVKRAGLYVAWVSGPVNAGFAFLKSAPEGEK
jgi:hypothetical protein